MRVIAEESVEIDRDEVNPDSLRAAWDFLVETLLSKTDATGLAIDWGTAAVRAEAGVLSLTADLL